MKNIKILITLISLLIVSNSLFSQSNEQILKELSSLRSYNSNMKHTYDALTKKIDDLLWYEKVGDIAYVDKVCITSENLSKPDGLISRGHNNPLKVWSYVFIPKSVDTHKKYPLIVFPHSGVHADMSTYYAHIIRELIAQEYIIIATEYRGSTGYGSKIYNSIDYGGRENADVKAGRDYMIENYSIVDKDRIGIMGWSHGGMITLMNLFEYPDAYKVGFAGVPVSDLLYRMAIATDSYRKIFSAPNNLGCTVDENVAEYKKRSPVWNVQKLKSPLMVYSNTIDDDVDVTEVQNLIQALKAANKKFEYKIFENAAGGHGFDRIDSKEATDIRYTIHKFMERYLKPNKPFKSASEMRKAAYKF